MVKEKALSITYAVSSSKRLREMRLIDLASADVSATSNTIHNAVSFLASDRTDGDIDWTSIAEIWIRWRRAFLVSGMRFVWIADKQAIVPARLAAVIISFNFDRVIKIRHTSVLFRTLHIFEMHQSIFQVLYRSAKLKTIVRAPPLLRKKSFH